VLGFHRGEFGFNVTYRLGEPFECILKAWDPHNVRLNIIMAERQTVTPVFVIAAWRAERQNRAA
jgi:hypothetical protein